VNRLKYILAWMATLSLTLLIMFLPNAYRWYADARQFVPQTRDIPVGQTAKILTPGQTMRILYDQAASGIFTEIQNTKADNDYADDCRDILRTVLGSEETSPLTQDLLGILRDSQTTTVTTLRFITVVQEDVVFLELVNAWFDELFICYETASKAAVEISVYETGYQKEVGTSNKYSDDMNRNTAFRDYYHSLGMKDGEFDYWAFNSKTGRIMFVGLFSYNDFDQYVPGLPIVIQTTPSSPKEYSR
jgi:hypothetical protein